MVVKGAERLAITAGRLVALVLILLLVTVAATVWLVFENAQQARDDLFETYERQKITGELFSAVQDAETGQRGFLLARDPAYILPYDMAVGRVRPLLDALTRATGTASPAEQDSVRRLRALIDGKLGELAEAIGLAQGGRYADALALVESGQGKQMMDDIREVLGSLDRASKAMLDEQTAAFRRAAQLRLIGTALIIALLFGGLLVAGILLRRAFRSLRDAEAKAGANAEQLRVSLDSLSQGISVFDAGFNLVSWNYCFAELFAIPDRLLRVGTPYAAFVRHDWTDDDGEFLETSDQLSAAPPETIGRSTPIVYERTHKDGRTFELRRTPLPSGGFVITYTDITQRLATEKQLRQTQRLDAIGQLTGGVAHDFNNLLTVIIGNLDLLRQKCSDPAQSRSFEMALAAADRGASLTRQLLAFARRQPLEPRPLDVNRLLSDLGGFLQRSLGEQVTVETIISAGLWTVLADPSQLENAILNLALNARDAMPDGGHLTIEAANAVLDLAYAKAHEEVQAGPYVMIAVTDTGHGMPPDVAARAFEPFFTTKGEGKGTGLGRSQVFGFVKQSGGHIKVYSELGSGTTIKLYLPRTTQAAVQVARPPEEVVRGHETVLIVEDDTEVRRVAVAMLRELGYACVEASNAHQALEILADPEIAVDMMFSDVILPGGMLGRELAARAQALDPALRVLYTSGYTQNAIIHNGRVDEGVVFLGKPYKKSELALKLRQLLDAPAHPKVPSSAAPSSPVLASPAPASPAPASRATVKPAEARSARTIVVVEDELLVLWSALDLLQDLGHEAIEATTAAEALALFDDGARSIDAMVTDLGLPDMRGDELVLKVRARRPDLPIVVASGYGESALSALAGLERIAYVPKPYDATALRTAFRSLGVG